jgi:drug/metabolite transporter (DMT)-like permease
VTFARLRPADWVVLVAALGLLLATAADWYSTQSGEEARTIEDSAEQLGPTALAGLAATLTALLVLYRILQEPGFDALTTVQLGAPLALALLGAIAFAAAVSVRQEEGAPTPDLQSRR